MAPGATRRQIVGLVLGRDLRLAALQVPESFLFATRPSDAEALTGVMVLLVSRMLQKAVSTPAFRRK